MFENDQQKNNETNDLNDRVLDIQKRLMKLKEEKERQTEIFRDKVAQLDVEKKEARETKRISQNEVIVLQKKILQIQ